MMPEGELTLRGPVIIGGDNLPSPVRIGLTDLPNIGWGAVAPLAPPVPASLKCIDLRLFSKCLVWPFLRSLRSKDIQC